MIIMNLLNCLSQNMIYMTLQSALIHIKQATFWEKD